MPGLLFSEKTHLFGLNGDIIPFLLRLFKNGNDCFDIFHQHRFRLFIRIADDKVIPFISKAR